MPQTNLSYGGEADECNPGVSGLLHVKTSAGTARLGGGLKQLGAVSRKLGLQ